METNVFYVIEHCYETPLGFRQSRSFRFKDQSVFLKHLGNIMELNCDLLNEGYKSAYVITSKCVDICAM